MRSFVTPKGSRRRVESRILPVTGWILRARGLDLELQEKTSNQLVQKLMYLKKICGGVLHIQTANGLRCVELTGRERLTLLWLFRNFKILPEAVLGNTARRLMDALLGSDRSQLRCGHNHADDDDFVIGTVEYVPAAKPGLSAARLITPKPVAAATDGAGLRSHVAS